MESLKKKRLPPSWAIRLPDNDQWINRFEVQSQSSDKTYIVAQNKEKGYYGCSCWGWKIHRNCKHLKGLNIPGQEKPYYD